MSYNGTSYTWQYGQLTKVTNTSGTTFYTYNAYGQRIQKKVVRTASGTTTTDNCTYNYDNAGRLIRESHSITTGSSTSGQTIILNYLYGSNGIVGCYFFKNGVFAPYSYIRNEKGDVTDVYNAAGTKVGSYSYDAYGNCTVSSTDEFVTTYNPIRYRGYYYDAETKFYFCNTRYYNPAWCRWISPDSINYVDAQSVDGLNLYAYCGNDPINFVDPSGHIATAILIGLIIGVTVGATSGGVIAYNSASNNGATGWELFGWTMLGIVGGGLIGGAIGAGIGALAPAIGSFLSSSFQFILPSLGSFFGGAATAGVAVTVTGAQIVAGVGIAALIGANILFSLRGKGPIRKSSNTSQNSFIDYMQQKYGFDDDFRQSLHRTISKKNFSKRIIEEIIKSWLGLP